MGETQSILVCGKANRVIQSDPGGGSAQRLLLRLSTPPSPSPKFPSVVTTEEGIEFSVYGLKLPGSSQELKLKKGGATTWVPLSIIQVITFTGPEEDRFRPALISLTSGERFTGEVFTDQLIEGTTDVGYWNMPMARIRQLGMGQD